MEHFAVLLAAGFCIGTIGTLIGAGGGFILVPMLILFRPDLSPEEITAISMAVVACNSISGSVAYMVDKRVDYRAGVLFALFTIPGSIAGVYTTKIIPRATFDVIFGVVLFALALFLFWRGGKKAQDVPTEVTHKGWISQKLTDRSGHVHAYAYDWRKGSFLSVLVGYFSPLLGIGGGIIHVPAMVEWLRFPVHIATATSHFILAVMASVTVLVHFSEGSYQDPAVSNTVIWLALGVIPGAQLGAFLSKRLGGKAIVRSLAVCLALVGLRILMMRFR